MKKYFLLFISVALLAMMSACRDDNELEAKDEEDNTGEEVNLPEEDEDGYPDWDDATHSKDAALNYDVVFNQNEVLRFDIAISSENWSAMQSNLASVMSSSNGRPGEEISIENPMFVPCSFKFNGTEWYNAGIRYKGNSSLLRAYQSGNGKLSLKLDFDEFEDDYPELKNQRFYGFKQLNLNNNFEDASLMREKVAADLFRQFGLAASKTAYCVIYLDNGSGPRYYGVYTIVEEMDDTVIETQFADGSGNLYKPDGDAASFAYGTYNTDEMELKTNEDEADYADVRALYDAINSSLRTSDVEAWKANLEAVFDVDGFLKWLAANVVIQNWDTYGNMAHNYYLYNNPENNLLTWIPWDNNEALQSGNRNGALSLSLNEVNNDWPLISYITADADYKALYHNYLQKFIDEVFIPSQLTETYAAHYELIKEHAYAEESGYTFIRNDAEFDSAVETLKNHAQSRNSAVVNYLRE